MFDVKILPYIFAEKNKKVILSTVLVLAFLFRFMYSFSIGSELRWYDEKNYHSIGVSLASGNGFESTFNPYSTTRWAPLQGYYIAAIYKVFGESPHVARVVQDLLSVLTCFLIFWLGKFSFNYIVGLIGATIFAFHPIFIYTANLFYPAANFTLLSILVFVLLIKGQQSGKIVHYSLAGLFLGLAMLEKPVAIFFIPAVFVALLFNKDRGMVSKAGHFCLVVTLAIIVLIPWTVKNYMKYDKWYFITTEGAHSLGATNNPDFSLDDWGDPDKENQLEKKVTDLNEEEQDKVYLQKAKSFIFEHPVQFLRLYTQKFVNFWHIYPNTKTKNEDISKTNKIISGLFYSFLFLFAIIGIIASFKAWRRLILYYGFILFFALGYSFFFTSIRYRLPIEPYVILFSAYAIHLFINKFFAIKPRR